MSGPTFLCQVLNGLEEVKVEPELGIEPVERDGLLRGIQAVMSEPGSH